MHIYLEDFHEAKVVFLEFRAHKKAKAQATNIRRLMQEEIADLDGPSKQSAITAMQIRDRAKATEMGMLKIRSDLNFPQIHVLKHLAEYISSYGYLGQYSTEISKRAHNKHIKEGRRKSTHVLPMAYILRYSDDYHSMMKMKTEIELAKPEACFKEYPRFRGKKFTRHRDITSL